MTDVIGRDLVRRAGELKSALAKGAADRDRARVFPLEEIRKVRDAGITAALVPRRFGGPGATFEELVDVILALAEADPNIAQCLQPHFALQDVLRLYGSEEQQTRYLGEIADGAIITNALAERGGKFIGDIATQAIPDGSGYRLDGTKYYCTGSLAADGFWTLSLTPEGERLIAIVGADQAGVRREDDWDAMGQRTTASGTVHLEGVRVVGAAVIEAEQVWTERNFIGASAQLSHTAIDTGIAHAALFDAVTYAQTRGRPAPESGVQFLYDDPYVIETIGRMRVQAVGAEAVVKRAARLLEEAAQHQLSESLSGQALDRVLAEASIAVAEAKVVSTNAALRNTELMYQVGGASMASRADNYDRHWRNARTHTVHDPLSYKLKAIGQFLLSDRFPVIGTKI